MLKKLAWNTFKNTGNINTMMELLEVSHIENNTNTIQNNNTTQAENKINVNRDNSKK